MVNARWASLALGIALCVLAPSVRAEPHAARAATAEDEADQALAEGRRLLDRGSLEKACELFQTSDHLSPTGRAVINLAECFERRGLFASAQANFVAAAKRAALAGLPDVERHARERADRLDARVPRVRFIVRPGADALGLVVMRDGVALLQESFNRGDAFDPGTVHTFEATAPGRTPFRATVTAREGVTADVELVWSRPEPSIASAPPMRSSSTRPLAWGLVGTGAAGVIVGTIAGIQVLSAQSAVASHCDASSRACDSEGAAAVQRGSTYEVIAPIALTAGVLLIGAGTYLLFSESRPRTAAAR